MHKLCLIFISAAGASYSHSVTVKADPGGWEARACWCYSSLGTLRRQLVNLQNNLMSRPPTLMESPMAVQLKLRQHVPRVDEVIPRTRRWHNQTHIARSGTPDVRHFINALVRSCFMIRSVSALRDPGTQRRQCTSRAKAPAKLNRPGAAQPRSVYLVPHPGTSKHGKLAESQDVISCVNPLPRLAAGRGSRAETRLQCTAVQILSTSLGRGGILKSLGTLVW